MRKRILKYNQTRSRSDAQAISHCRDLIWINSAPLKNAEQKKCREVYKKIETAKKKIEEHEAVNQPEYKKWFHSLFGKELSEMRELAERISQKRELITLVLDESDRTGCSKRNAYLRITQAQARLKEAEKKYWDHQDPNPKDGFTSKEKSNPHQEESLKEDLLRAAFEIFHGPESQWDDPFQSYEEAFQEFKSSSEDDRQNQNQKNNSYADEDEFKDSGNSLKPESRLKELYRQLVRKLHPDHNPNPDSRQIELWHQVQEAYQNHALDRLETLFVMSDVFNNSWDQIEGISPLKKLFRELTVALKQLERKIREARKDPAWRFQDTMQDPWKRMSMEASTKQDLSRMIRNSRAEEKELEDLIREWAKPRKHKNVRY